MVVKLLKDHLLVKTHRPIRYPLFGNNQSSFQKRRSSRSKCWHGPGVGGEMDGRRRWRRLRKLDNRGRVLHTPFPPCTRLPKWFCVGRRAKARRWQGQTAQPWIGFEHVGIKPRKPRSIGYLPTETFKRLRRLVRRRAHSLFVGDKAYH